MMMEALKKANLELLKPLNILTEDLLGMMKLMKHHIWTNIKLRLLNLAIMLMIFLVIQTKKVRNSLN
jgi:hypothetical protein